MADAKKTKTLKLTQLPGFDADFYLAKYEDVRKAGVDPVKHYLEHGWKEGRDPSDHFSTEGYLNANPDVRASGQNPLVHFLNNGMKEGRLLGQALKELARLRSVDSRRRRQLEAAFAMQATLLGAKKLAEVRERKLLQEIASLRSQLDEIRTSQRSLQDS
jgi:hypothetical protein